MLWLVIVFITLKTYPFILITLNLLFFSFVIIPRIVVLVSLGVDIFYFHEFNYVYKVSILLLLPLMKKYFIYIHNEFYRTNCEYYDETLVISQDNLYMLMSCDNYLTCITHYIVKVSDVFLELTPDFIKKHKNKKYNIEKTIEFHSDNIHEILLPLVQFRKAYFNVKSHTQRYFDCGFYFFYSVIWIYVLIYSF